jgi:hypothetical protein
MMARLILTPWDTRQDLTGEQDWIVRGKERQENEGCHHGHTDLVGLLVTDLVAQPPVESQTNHGSDLSTIHEASLPLRLDLVLPIFELHTVLLGEFREREERSQKAGIVSNLLVERV